MPYLLPAIPNPPTRICIPINVPNDPEHLQVFWGHLSLLGLWYSWERDDDHTARTVAAVWKDVWNQARDAFVLGGCMSIYDLRQTGILIERKNSAAGAWTTLYDPRNYVILKAPTADYQNWITAPTDVRGLWARQLGNEWAIVGSQDGASGGVSLFAQSNASNADTVMLLDRPVSNGDYLRAKVNGLENTVINRYGQINAIVYNANLPQANANTLGAIIYLNGSASPSTSPDGAYIGSFVIVGSTPVYFWNKFKGDKGDTGDAGGTGETGARGRNISFTDPANGAALYPNQAPYLQVFDENPLTQYVKGFFPRAPQFSFNTPINRSPGDFNETVFSIDTNGDWIGQPYRAQGLPGEPGGSFDDIIVDPPEEGQTIVTTVDVLADSGTLLPILLPGNCQIQAITTRGLWVVSDSTGTIYQDVTGADGIPDAGHTINKGKLMIGAKLETAQAFSFIEYDALPLDFPDPTYVMFAQNRNYAEQYGIGHIPISVQIYRQAVVEWDLIGEQLFTSFPNDWHVATSSDNPAASSFGGQWLSTDGGGFHPTSNAIDGKHLSIAPRRTGHWHVDSIEVFIKNNTDAAGITVFLWIQDNATHAWSVQAINGFSGASGSVVLTLNRDIEYLTISSHNYPHASADWQFWKAIVTGSDL